MIKLFRNLKPVHWFGVIIAMGFIVMQVWLDLRMPDYTRNIIVNLKTGGALKDIWINGGWMMLCALGSLLAAMIVGYIAARIAAAFSRRLRSQLFTKVDSFSSAEINMFSTPSLITRTTNDVSQVQMVITNGLQVMIKAPILAVWAIAKIAGKGFEWSMATAVAVLILMLLFTFILIIVLPKFRQMQTLTDNINRVTRENLTGLPVVRAYNAEDYQEAKFEKASDEFMRKHLFTSRSMAVISPIMTLVMSGLSLAIYWFGAVLINAAPLAERGILFADMSVFSSYAMQVIMAFMMITMMFIMLPRASVSAKRINEVLDTVPSIVGGEVKQGAQGIKGTVEFKNVSFKYPGAAEYVLRDINFKVNMGETVAFIGSTGCGKSTLVNLVPRFYDATEGEVLVDGVNIKDYDLESLRNKLGYIPQKVVMFSGTVSSNVAYGDNGDPNQDSEENIKRAVRIAQAKEFVEAMDGQYEAEVARDGTNVSGGQKQRLSIARAINRNPEIIIFDDSFSALDYKTDRELRSTVKRETQGVTSMIVAQRIGTIMDADKIIVLEEGAVVGMGTHKELLKTCEVYKEIATSQLSEKELKKGGVL